MSALWAVDQLPLSPAPLGNPRVTTLCGHSYHLQCMYSWLDHGHTTCPYCDAPVDPDLL